MGHSTKDVTDLYESHEVERYLIKDTDKIERFVRAGEKHTLKLQEGQA